MEVIKKYDKYKEFRFVPSKRILELEETFLEV